MASEDHKRLERGFMVPWRLSRRAIGTLAMRLKEYDARVILPEDYTRLDDLEIPFHFQWILYI